MRIVVAGAHMRGFPLNKQLLDLQASYVSTQKTAKKYRLYKLNEMKPGLLLQPNGSGNQYEVELWDIPDHKVGDFLGGCVAAPLALGKVHLDDGTSPVGFVCQSGGVDETATDISGFSGWKAYKDAQTATVPSFASFGALRAIYKAGLRSPADVALHSLQLIRERGNRDNAFIAVPDEAFVRAQAERLAGRDPAKLPLYGLPFVVKDNIDVAGLPTTAACPDFSYNPKQNATAVQHLMDAGAICVGKTNMDQFATGLVGTRSPYGVVRNAYNPDFISGGSSSGSAVAVANQLACFSLGTDTAGSGRIPAAFNKLVGLKPTVGSVSNSGVVPACKSLDCVSVFAHNCGDALDVYNVMKSFDPTDDYSLPPEEFAAPPGRAFRFGVPSALEFFGDAEAEARYWEAVDRLATLGGQRVEIDFTPFRETADMLYQGPWVAERQDTIFDFKGQMDPTVKKVISTAEHFTARDAFRYMYKLQHYKRITAPAWEQMDCLVTPTAGTIYTAADVLEDPIRLNTNLGYYTNYVNLLGLSAVSTPAGNIKNGPHFGITFISQAWSEPWLCDLGSRFME